MEIYRIHLFEKGLKVGEPLHVEANSAEEAAQRACPGETLVLQGTLKRLRAIVYHPSRGERVRPNTQFYI